MSNYPPGVTGNEPQITGEWPHEFVPDDGGNSTGEYEDEPPFYIIGCLECGEPRENKMHQILEEVE